MVYFDIFKRWMYSSWQKDDNGHFKPFKTIVIVTGSILSLIPVYLIVCLLGVFLHNYILTYNECGNHIFITPGCLLAGLLVVIPILITLIVFVIIGMCFRYFAKATKVCYVDLQESYVYVQEGKY